MATGPYWFRVVPATERTLINVEITSPLEQRSFLSKVEMLDSLSDRKLKIMTFYTYLNYFLVFSKFSVANSLSQLHLANFQLPQGELKLSIFPILPIF